MKLLQRTALPLLPAARDPGGRAGRQWAAQDAREATAEQFGVGRDKVEMSFSGS
jgi:hypothetical protein